MTKYLSCVVHKELKVVKDNLEIKKGDSGIRFRGWNFFGELEVAQI